MKSTYLIKIKSKIASSCGLTKDTKEQWAMYV